jgi:hypothetical protein
MEKKALGQFYTTRVGYILDGFDRPPPGTRIVEPFAGAGDLIDWLGTEAGYAVHAFDIDPKRPEVLQRDTLADPPCYADAWVLTNPPYLARNKSGPKDIYDQYETNDLYKCFIRSLVHQGCLGGILIIPAGFFFSSRDVDARVRDEFLRMFRLTRVRYFEETVFDDTATTVVAVAFQQSPDRLSDQDVPWELFPGRVKKTFPMEARHKWIVGGAIHDLPGPAGVSVRRHVEGQELRPGETQTFMTLNALDSGRQKGRIALEYRKDYVYPAKECSRTWATLRITGRVLSEREQIEVCRRFNEFLEARRSDTWSLFLPQFRESKEYARKRIPFELAYKMVLHQLG